MASNVRAVSVPPPGTPDLAVMITLDNSEHLFAPEIAALQALPTDQVKFNDQQDFPNAYSKKAYMGKGISTDTHSAEWPIYAFLFSCGKYANAQLHIQRDDGEYEKLDLDQVKFIASLVPIFESIKAVPHRVSAFVKYCFVKNGAECVLYTKNLHYDLAQAARAILGAQRAEDGKETGNELMPPPQRPHRRPSTPTHQMMQGSNQLGFRIPNPDFSTASSITLSGMTPARPNFPALSIIRKNDVTIPTANMTPSNGENGCDLGDTVCLLLR